MFRTLASALALTLAAGLQTAGAQDTQDDSITESVTVRYADLNLDHQADAAIMVKRMTTAARRACGGWPQFQPMYETMSAFYDREFKHCFENAMSHAVAELGAPVVTAAYEGEQPRTVVAGR